MSNDTEAMELPPPAFRLKWVSRLAAYYVSEPNIGDTDCYTADQMRAAVAKVAAELVQMRDDRDSWLEQASSRLADALQFAAERDDLRAKLEAAENERTMWRKEATLLGFKLLTCGVAATHPDPELSSRQKDYGGKWDSPQAEDVRKLRAERDQLRAELDSVLADWNALVKASGSPTNGGAIGHVGRLRAELEAVRSKKPVGWFNQHDDYHGYQQVARPFEGSVGTVPLYGGPAAAPVLKPLTTAQANHLRRLIGWASCEVGQSPDEMVQGVRALAAQGLNTDEEGKARLLQAHQKASNVPKYIREAIKALRKMLDGIQPEGGDL